MFNDIYKGKRVLVTGHTGFKGSWLTVWLNELGAEVCGISLPMEGEFSHYALLKPDIRSYICDIRDAEKLGRIVTNFRPDAVFHLAAQPLVRRSYRDPAGTFAANVMGTVNVLEACRKCDSVRAVVAVTSDKCYDNPGTHHRFRETDPMGGGDPYSASKGCAELVVSSYRRSFFRLEDYGVKHRMLIASGRAGNVVGGGDWAEDRLIPDIMRAAAARSTVELRNPRSVRPWQHVLEPLSGYLALGEKLFAGEKDFSGGWNFGPEDGGTVTVEEAAGILREEWPDIVFRTAADPDAPPEAEVLRLNCAKARRELKWRSVWSPDEAFRRTARWYRDFYRKGAVTTMRDWNEYIAAAKGDKLAWTK